MAFIWPLVDYLPFFRTGKGNQSWIICQNWPRPRPSWPLWPFPRMFWSWYVYFSLTEQLPVSWCLCSFQSFVYIHYKNWAMSWIIFFFCCVFLALNAPRYIAQLTECLGSKVYPSQTSLTHRAQIFTVKECHFLYHKQKVWLAISRIFVYKLIKFLRSTQSTGSHLSIHVRGSIVKSCFEG